MWGKNDERQAIRSMKKLSDKLSKYEEAVNEICFRRRMDFRSY